MAGNSSEIFALLGNPVGHSLSPLMHNATFKRMNIAAQYVPFCVKNLEDAVRGIRGLDIRGVSITIPFKTAVMPYLDEVDESSHDETRQRRHTHEHHVRRRKRLNHGQERESESKDERHSEHEPDANEDVLRCARSRPTCGVLPGAGLLKLVPSIVEVRLYAILVFGELLKDLLVELLEVIAERTSCR